MACWNWNWNWNFKLKPQLVVGVPTTLRGSGYYWYTGSKEEWTSVKSVLLLLLLLLLLVPCKNPWQSHEITGTLRTDPSGTEMKPTCPIYIAKPCYFLDMMWTYFLYGLT
jgi:hypothetical protein